MNSDTDDGSPTSTSSTDQMMESTLILMVMASPMLMISKNEGVTGGGESTPDKPGQGQGQGQTIKVKAVRP